MAVLNITNGDSAAALLHNYGDVLVWRDPMHHGPFTAHHNQHNTSSMRATYLAGEVLDAARVRLAFAQRDSQLQNSASYTQIILWFEHDLLDQLQILQILDWYSHHYPQAPLQLICINHYEGIDNFRGLGQLNSEQLRALLSHKQTVTTDMLLQAQHLWTLFRDTDPQPLLHFAKQGNSNFSYLCAALLRHFEEYPWIVDGLSRTQRQLLSLLNNAADTPNSLFLENMNLEKVLYIGDWRTFSELDYLARNSAIAGANGDYRYSNSAGTPDIHYRQQQLVVTAYGRNLLSGTDKIPPSSYDHWLGGVHLNADENLWYWNPQSELLQR